MKKENVDGIHGPSSSPKSKACFGQSQLPPVLVNLSRLEKEAYFNGPLISTHFRALRSVLGRTNLWHRTISNAADRFTKS